VVKRQGAFKSEKRKKELIRQKKQEEKRQRRLHQDTDVRTPAEVSGQEVQQGEGEKL
jgi:hypothetical protein